MTRKILFRLFLIFITFSPTYSFSKSLKEIIEQGELRVGTTGDYRPFSYLKDGEYKGLDIEIAKKMAKDLGVKLNLVKTSWPTLMQDYENDLYDIGMSGISITLDRQKKAYFSTPLLLNGKAPITLCENKSKYRYLKDINSPETKVIVNPGGTNEKFAKSNLYKANIILHEDNNTIFEEIIKGNANLMVTDLVEVKLQSSIHKELCQADIGQLSFSEIGYLVSKDVALKMWVDQWLHRANKTKLLDQLTTTWLSKDAWK